VRPEETLREDGPVPDPALAADAILVEQICRGDTDASDRFFREYYPRVYRYLLWLTERPEAAEDLAQETFVRAWRHLDRFEPRAPLRVWLMRIARREFLRSLQSQRVQASLDEVAEAADARTAELTEAVELRTVIRKLPVEQAEVVVLHYLQGYDYQEIAQILRAPASTVKYRLMAARSHLQRELGEGDLVYLNEPAAPMRQWAWLPLDRMHFLETRLATRPSGEGEALGPGSGKEEAMERREFLRQAAAGAAGLMLADADKDAVDGRLTQKVTLTFKGTALSDVCAHLQSETGIRLEAGLSVADEKVTVFCAKLPLRDVMRQLSRPFGYTWLRSGTKDEYRYELVQDLRSQLLEEELRNRDRNAALLALEREVERYRPYLGLTPDEALAQAEKAPPIEKKLLQDLAGWAWGPIQAYFRLTANDLATLRDGKHLRLSASPGPGEQPMPPELARGVLQSMRDWRIRVGDDRLQLKTAEEAPDGLPLASVPEVRAMIQLELSQSELGHFALQALAGVFTVGKRPGTYTFTGAGPLAAGRSPAVQEPGNAIANAKLARDTGLQARVTVRPTTDHRPPTTDQALNAQGSTLPSQPPALNAQRSTLNAQGPAPSTQHPTPEKVTTADVLEALHQATGKPIVADYYTRLYPLKDVSAHNLTLFDALNRLGDALRLRWNQDGEWLWFRSTSFYDNRLKEVPNRLLAGWTAARRHHGHLRLDELVEIAQLPDAQLNADGMAEGARLLFGLEEWDLARYRNLRAHLRYLAGFTPAQRQEATSATGLLFTRMTLAQQQTFISLGIPAAQGLQALLLSGAEWIAATVLPATEELPGSILRVDYTQPGGFQWKAAGPRWRQWVIPLEPGPEGRRMPRPPVRQRTREAALQAARRIDPQVTEAEIVPTELDLVFIYIPGRVNRTQIYMVRPQSQTGSPTWE
jgi:RNA polymerase sigma-70 factor (ECF subfamily)